MDRRSFLKGLALLPFAKRLLHKVKEHPWNDIIPCEIEMFLAEPDGHSTLSFQDSTIKPIISYRDKVMEHEPIYYSWQTIPDWSFKDEQGE